MYKIDLRNAEFSINSQNGEDGILEALASYLKNPKYTFLEIGCSDGRENNSTYLLKKNWTGLGIDMSRENISHFAKMADEMGCAGQLQLLAGTVSYFTVTEVMDFFVDIEPDIFSLDIDSIDYYVMYKFLVEGFRPKIICAEFNSFLGSGLVTVEYKEHFRRYEFDPERGLYFGVALNAYRWLLEPYGYKFVGVDKAGVNAFFVREDAFDSMAISQLVYLEFAYNAVFLKKYKMHGEALRDELLSRSKLKFLDVREIDVETTMNSQLMTRPVHLLRK